MVVGIKDAVKLIGISIIACCAVFVCTLFLNYNIDIVAMRSEIVTAAGIAMYHAQVSTGKVVAAVSGGEQQRVSVARALAKKPKVLFLDEPTGALDEQTGRQVLDYICKLHKEYGFTIVMVTHNQNIAEMANTVVKMNSGKISEVYTNKKQKTAYEIGW